MTLEGTDIELMGARGSSDGSPPDKSVISRQLASLALAWMKQSGQLKVRQREQLRRTLHTAATALSWSAIAGDRLEAAVEDVIRLARNGTRSITRDLDNELEGKRTEMAQLTEAVEALRELAEDPNTEYPVAFSYRHTARSYSQGLITKTEELELADAGEALEAAETIEKRFDSWDKLRKEMLEELKESQGSVVEMRRNIKKFVESSEGTVREVFAVMY